MSTFLLKLFSCFSFKVMKVAFIISNESFSGLEYNKKLLFEGDIVSGLVPLREEVINVFSEITASIDFVDDEDFNFNQIKKKIRKFFINCNNLLQLSSVANCNFPYCFAVT